jgi:hypothetical protein
MIAAPERRPVERGPSSMSETAASLPAAEPGRVGKDGLVSLTSVHYFLSAA